MATKNRPPNRVPTGANKPPQRPSAARRAATSAGGGGAKSRSKAGTRGGGRSRAFAITWISATVVVVVVVSLIIVKVTGGSNTAPASSAAPADVVRATTSVPQSALAAVGNGTSSNPPKAITAPALTSNGKPEVLYVGAEYCPYCAAERWALVVALSKFGTFSNLGRTTSSSTDVYPSTQTFTFHGSTFSSPYLVFTPVEQTTNQPSGSGYTPLDTLTSEQQSLLSKYDGPPYTSANSSGGIPFIYFAGHYIISGATYSPQVLQGLDMGTIASQLSDPSNDVAQGVNGSANLIIAAICKATGQQPANVCNTPTIAKAESSLAK